MVHLPSVPGPEFGVPFFVVGAGLSCFLGVLVLYRSPRSVTHLAFALASFCITVFDAGFVVVNGARDLGTVWLAYRIASIGFCFLPWAATWLVFRMVEVRPPLWYLVPLGLLCLVFLGRSWTGVLYVAGFTLEPSGNGYLHAVDSPWYWAFQGTYIVHAVNLALLGWKWSRVKTRRQQAQFRLLTLSYAGAAVLHFLQSSIPSMTGLAVPWLVTVLPVNALLAACQAWAILRYRFLGLDAPWVDWQVLRLTKIPVAQFDAQGRLLWSNPASRIANRAPADWGNDPGARRYPVVDRRGRDRGQVIVGGRPPLAPPPDDQNEAELARLVLAGWSNKEIAAAVGQAEGTVKNRLSRLYRKWQVRNRAELRRRLG